MNTFLRIVALVVLMVGLGLGAWYILGCPLPDVDYFTTRIGRAILCDIEVVDSAASDDGRWRIVAAKGKCGATTRASVVVFLQEGSAAIDGANADGDNILFSSDVGPSFKFRWTAPRNVEVTCVGVERHLVLIRRYSEVTVSYVDCDVPMRGRA